MNSLLVQRNAWTVSKFLLLTNRTYQQSLFPPNIHTINVSFTASTATGFLR